MHIFKKIQNDFKMKVEKNEVENNENRQSGVHGKICE